MAGGGSVPLALVVEDDPDARRLLARALEPALSVVMRDGVAAAESFLASELPDVILLDVGLPDGSGHELCARLQADPRTRDVPVLFVSASGDIRDKLSAFSLGAEDYVEKPFVAAELRARVQARLARARSSHEGSEVFEKGALRFEVAEYRALGIEGGVARDLELTPHEFRLLYHLARQENRVLTRAQLRRAAWGDTIVSERTVDAHVSHLRRKLASLRGCIESVRGIGYRWISRPPEAADRPTPGARE